jgi:hypothetical protein
MAEKDRKLILTTCKDCGCIIKHRPNKPKIICRKCFYKCRTQLNRIKIECTHCKKIFFKKKSALKNSKHNIYFCSRQCKDLAQSLSGNCDAIRPPHYGASNGKHLWKILIKETSKCISCDESKKYLFEVHHIDGNRENNIIENLEVVCRNCHAKRHLKLNENNEWCYDNDYLTPREIIDKL